MKRIFFWLIAKQFCEFLTLFILKITYILLYKVDPDTDVTFKNIDMQKGNTKILV